MTEDEQRFWDSTALSLLRLLAPMGVNGDIDDYGPKESASDSAQFADALLRERRERQKTSALA